MNSKSVFIDSARIQASVLHHQILARVTISGAAALTYLYKCYCSQYRTVLIWTAEKSMQYCLQYEIKEKQCSMPRNDCIAPPIGDIAAPAVWRIFGLRILPYLSSLYDFTQKKSLPGDQLQQEKK